MFSVIYIYIYIYIHKKVNLFNNTTFPKLLPVYDIIILEPILFEINKKKIYIYIYIYIYFSHNFKKKEISL